MIQWPILIVYCVVLCCVIEESARRNRWIYSQSHVRFPRAVHALEYLDSWKMKYSYIIRNIRGSLVCKLSASLFFFCWDRNHNKWRNYVAKPKCSMCPFFIPIGQQLFFFFFFYSWLPLPTSSSLHAPSQLLYPIFGF